MVMDWRSAEKFPAPRRQNRRATGPKNRPAIRTVRTVRLRIERLFRFRVKFARRSRLDHQAISQNLLVRSTSMSGINDIGTALAATANTGREHRFLIEKTLAIKGDRVKTSLEI